MLTINGLLGRIDQFILNPLIVLMFVVSLLVFFWGLVEFITKAGEEGGRETGRRNILYGIIGMCIMVGVYGIIHVILATFGIPVPLTALPFLGQ